MGTHIDNKLLIKLFIDNASQTGLPPYFVHLTQTYWHNSLHLVRSPHKIKMYLFMVARVAANHILLKGLIS